MEKEMEKAKNLVKYCDSVYKTQRRKTRTVHCGDVPIGTTSITTYIDTCTYLTKTFTPCNLPIGTTYGLHTLPHIFFCFLELHTVYILYHIHTLLHTLPHTYFQSNSLDTALLILTTYTYILYYYIHIHTLLHTVYILYHTHTLLHTLPHTYFATYILYYIHIHTLLHTVYILYHIHTLLHTYSTCARRRLV